MQKLRMVGVLLIPALTAFSLSAYAVGQVTPISFYNNTNLEVTVSESTFIGGMTNCQGNPYSACLQQQSPITLDPHSSGVINLVSAVTAQQIYMGAVGFSITTDAASQNTAVVSVMADPAGAFALIDFEGGGGSFSDANSQNESYAFNAMPQYTVSVAQNIQGSWTKKNLVAQQTVVSINPVQIQQQQ